MMRRIVRCVVLLGFGVTVPVSLSIAQALDDATVLAAIKAGETGKLDPLVSDCVATAGFGEGMGAALAGGIQPTGAFDVIASTNAGRIAYMAARGKRLYKPLKPEDVPETLRSPIKLFVVAEPHKPQAQQNSYSVPSPIEHVVLKSKNVPTAVVQPESVEKEAVEWGNLMGGKVQSNRAIAVFELSLLKELPPGDVDIVLVTEAGERRCKIGAKDRAKLLR